MQRPAGVLAPVPARASSSLEGLDPDGEREVFGDGPGGSGQAPTAPAIAVPSTVAPAPAGGAAEPRSIALEYEEGVYEYGGEPIARTAMRVEASSTRCETGGSPACHDAERVADEDDATAWCEGASGAGAGAWIAFDLGRPREMTQVRLVPGYAKDRRHWVSNSRPRSVVVEAGDERFAFELPNQTDAFAPDRQLAYAVPVLDFLAALGRPVTARHVRLHVRAVHPGASEDMCISEITLYAR